MEPREAVERTIKMWEWLANHPGCWKWDYLELNEPKVQPLTNQCYLCDIWIDMWGDYCGGCPLGTKQLYCMLRRSPFELWAIATGLKNWNECTKQAKRIVNACKRWLEEHEDVTHVTHLDDSHDSHEKAKTKKA